MDHDNALTAETINGTNYSFEEDGDGNLTSWSGGWSLAYNAKNQTTSASDGGANQTQSYTYSGADQQEVLSATVGGSQGYTLQFANSALGETYQEGSNSSYTHAFARDNRGALVSRDAGSGEYDFYLFDGLGSVVALTDSDGNVLNRYAYDPYGNLTEDDTTTDNPFEYVSGWTGAAGFTHFGARWYATDPVYARWTQQDPTAGDLFKLASYR